MPNKSFLTYLQGKQASTSGISMMAGLDAAGSSVVKVSPPAFKSITDYGAVSGASAAANTIALNAAIAANKLLYIPAGSWSWTGTLSATGVTWLIDQAATFPLAATVGPHSLPDLSILGGRIVWMEGTSSGAGWRQGSGNLWPESTRNYSISIAEFSVTSPTGLVGVLGASRTSDDPVANFGTIALYGIALNDNTTNKEPAWGGYFDVRRNSNTGAALGVEIDVINVAATYDSLTPFTTRSTTSSDLIALWLSSGGGSGGPANGDASAAIGIHDNGQKFERGIVILNGALNTTVNEALSVPNGARLAWYDSPTSLLSYINGLGAQFTVKSDTAASGYEENIFRKRANGTDATGALDEVFRINGYSYTGSGNYAGGYIQMLQRTAFSGGNARHSIDLSAKNAAGSDILVTLNGVTDSAFTPFPDNTIGSGSSSARWANTYSTNIRPGAGTAIWTSGSGTPEGSVTAPVGSLYTRTDGGAGTTLYVKESGSGNTGWVGK
jgi:hypothetical protein